MSPTRDQRVRSGSQRRREQQRSDVRQAILDAAAALFAEAGYDGVSLRAVAERIGYTATTIYLHFADKDDLLFTVADDGFTRFGAALAAAAEPPDPLARIHALGRAYIDFGLANPAYYALMFVDRPDFLLGCRAGESQPRIAALDIVRQAVQQGIDTGAIRSGGAEVYAAALWASVHGVVAMAIARPDLRAEHIATMADAVLDLMIDGLRAAR